MTTSRRPFADPLVAACKPHSIAQGCELAQVTVAGLVSSRTHHCCCGRGRGGELLRDAQETRPCGLHAMRYMAIEWIVCREQKERASTRRGRATLRPSSGRRVVVRGSLIPYGRGQLERQSRRAIVMVMVTVQCSRPLPAGCDGSVYCTALCPSLLPVTGILPLYRAPPCPSSDGKPPRCHGTGTGSSTQTHHVVHNHQRCQRGLLVLLLLLLAHGYAQREHGHPWKYTRRWDGHGHCAGAGAAPSGGPSGCTASQEAQAIVPWPAVAAAATAQQDASSCCPAADRSPGRRHADEQAAQPSHPWCVPDPHIPHIAR